ncbi:MAG TPA: hypothetical protein VFC17_06360 [Candidatus Limnocylindrales bacterium]|nr:hypothetical protein [Candidatus Limnocylindrales bacterium]
MNIQPPSSHPREIGVTEAIEPAYERVKQMLFKPFNLTKWITIGFCAWLAGFGESGGGGGGFNGYNGGDHHFNGNNGGEHIRQVCHQARDYALVNLYWIIPVAIMVVLVVVALWLLVLWLSSRGKFMFLHCVALDKAEVEVPWRKFAGAANSLFWFRLVVGLSGMVVMLPLLGFIALSIVRMVLQGGPDVAGGMSVVGLGLVFFLLALVFALIHKFLVDFVVPIMFLRGGSCLAAWREFYALLSANAGKFTVYILFQIVLTMAIGALVLMAILVTCCLAGCLMLLPFVGTVLLLPVLVFKRAYPLYYLAQYGPQYDVFPIPPDPTTLPAQPLVAG